MDNLPSNGTVPIPGAVIAAPKRIELPGGPLTGRSGDEILTKAIEHALVEPDPVEPTKPPGESGKPDPATPPPGGDGVPPAETLPPKPNDAEAEQAELATRAQANGVTVEQQAEAETAELARLQTKATQLGLTVEQVAAQEETAAAAGMEKKFSTQDVEAMIQKRIKSLNEENEELKRQVSGRSPAPSQPSGFLATITDPGKLAEIESTASAGMEYTSGLIRRLSYAPQAVEKELRRLADANEQVAAKFTRFENGEMVEDFSTERMAEVLEEHESLFRNQLKAVPQRRKYLEDYAKVHEMAVKVQPWMSDPEDPRMVLFKSIEQAFPGAKLSPAWEYWLGAAAEKHLERQQALKRNGTPAARPGKFIPKVTFPKTTSRGGSLPPPINGDRTAQLKAKLKADPRSEKALEEYFASRL